MEYITFLAAYPVWIKVCLSLGVVLIVIAVLGMIFVGTSAKSEKTENAAGSTVITSHGQQGGITAHTVNGKKE